MVFFGFQNPQLKTDIENLGSLVTREVSTLTNDLILRSNSDRPKARASFSALFPNLRYVLLETVEKEVRAKSKVKPIVEQPKTLVETSPVIKSVPRFELRVLTPNSTDKRRKLFTSFSVERLEKDMSNDAFIHSAIQSELECLRNKLVIYKKLSGINWGDESGKKPKLGVVINDMMTKIAARIAFVEHQTIANKRTSMASIIYDPDYGINSIKGKARNDMKTQLVKFIYMFFKAPTFYSGSFTNFMLTGPAGSGKTKVAMCIAHVLSNIGLLATSNVVSATKTTLVASFVGQSAKKTRDVLAHSLEGVLFIDEAYTLTPCKGGGSNSDSDYEKEAIGELVNFIDKFIGCIVVIVAGYKKIMHDCFLTFNEGIARRFPRVIDLPPYSSNDLWNIFAASMGPLVGRLSTSQSSFIASMIDWLNSQQEHLQVFSNQAGDMLNLATLTTEDMLLIDGQYDDDAIVETFRSFCANKNLELYS